MLDCRGIRYIKCSKEEPSQTRIESWIELGSGSTRFLYALAVVGNRPLSKRNRDRWFCRLCDILSPSYLIHAENDLAGSDRVSISNDSDLKDGDAIETASEVFEKTKKHGSDRMKGTYFCSHRVLSSDWSQVYSNWRSLFLSIISTFCRARDPAFGIIEFIWRTAICKASIFYYSIS